ncbi:hypothetical protein GOHSU_16_00740 [Gordonia hirsuta DSM 44140 = NBRC 16056]|uniref:Uncharacterized protein n=1 Tax=Gordonia hirsuta DSM 44140 = NBRC 16056 TaxID=1121927 RepID=L7LAM9_9ACTN|nr:hypothetical protein [Gordonia hirsuta]GAC57117.1 hypothetical protein GOHSU_16_00740 [Gordonia hirsuta DSM 44140 = NBRC 16056]
MNASPQTAAETAAADRPQGQRTDASGAGSSPGLSDRLGVRLALLLTGGVSLLAGLDAALLLLGLGAPVGAGRLADVHGMLMVYGFVGTLVALERAVALGAAWALAAPAGFGLGAIALIGAPAVGPARVAPGGALLVIGAAALVAVYIPLWRRNHATAVLVQAGGAVAALGGAILFVAGIPVPWLLPWPVAFLVLTIAGERLELARVAFLNPRVEAAVAGAAVAVLAGVLAALLWPTAGYRVFAAMLLILAALLLRYDVARGTVRGRGLPRFSAVCLLTGYLWLLVAGGIWAIAGPVRSGPAYDASAHAVFLGFVISMIFAHAPIILPAVLRRPLPYRPIMYLPVVLLHGSLLLRIAVGDGAGQLWAVTLGGVLNVVAVLAFLVIAVGSVLLGAQKSADPQQGAPKPGAQETGESA